MTSYLRAFKTAVYAPLNSSRQSDPERRYSANIVRGVKSESSWSFCLTEQLSVFVSGATIRSSVLAGTLLSTYLYTRQLSEVQTQKPNRNEHGSSATFSHRQVQ